MMPAFFRKSFLFLTLGAFALLFGAAQSAWAATCASYGDGTPYEWQKADVPPNPSIDNCTIQYDDPTGGSNLTVCQYRVLSDGTNDGIDNPTETLGWTNAANTVDATGAIITCGGSSAILQADISIGTSLNCPDNGVNKCRVEFKAEDNAGNSGTGTIVTLDIDYASPIDGSVSYANGFTFLTSAAVTVNDGTDADSGILTRVIQRALATLSNGTCGAYESFTNISTITSTDTSHSFTDSDLASDTCYQYQYLVSDNAGNQKTYTSSSVVKVDTVASRVDAFDVTPKDPAWVNRATPNAIVSWNDSGVGTGITEFGGSGLKQIEVWRAWDANGDGTLQSSEWDDSSPTAGAQTNPIYTKTSGFTSATTDDGSYTDTALTANGTYWYGLHVKDNADNCITEDTNNADGKKGHCGGVTLDGLDTRPDKGSIKVIVDKTHLVTTLTSVAGDVSSPYWDRVNDLGNPKTDIVVEGEANMLCRWGDTDDVVYSSMPSENNCPVSGSTATCSLSLAQPASYTKHVSCKDAAGNEQPVDSALPEGNKDVTFGVDWTAPSGSIEINGGATYATGTSVNLGLTCTDSVSLCDKMSFSNDGTNFSSEEIFAVNKNWPLASGDGAKTVYVRYKDTAGNESSLFSDAIILDTTEPGIPNLISPSLTVSTTMPLFRWSAVDDPSGVTYTLWADNNSDFNINNLEINQSGLTSSSYTPGNGILVDGQTYYWKVRAVDGAGNIGNFPAHKTFTVALNKTPSISSAEDSPDPLGANTRIDFNATWSDLDAGDRTKLHICKTDSIFASTQTCSGGSWCDNAAFSSTSPTACNGTSPSSSGTQNYYAFVCDDDNACSSSMAGTFLVDAQAPSITTFTITPQSPAWVNAATTNVVVSFEVSDSGGSALRDVEIYRYNPAGHTPVGWNKIGTVPASSFTLKQGSTDIYQGFYQDPAPNLQDNKTYQYGIHVNDNAGNMRDESDNTIPADPYTGGPLSVQVDKTRPSAIINQINAQADPTNASPIEFTAVFSESVSGFTGGDVSFVGSTAGGTLTASVTPVSGAIYNIVVTGMTSSGTVIATIPTGGAIDGAGNGNSISTSTDNTVTYDISPPTVTSVSSTAVNGNYTAGAGIPITITFSESVIVTGTPQLTLATGGAGTAVHYTSGSPGTILTFQYTVALGHNSSDLDYTSTTAFALNGGTIKDAVGNNANLILVSPGAANSLGANKNIVVDTIAPTVTDFRINDTPCIGGGCPAVLDKDALNIEWAASDNVGGSGIWKYEIWRAQDTDGDGSPNWSGTPYIASATSPYTSENPAEGTYWYGIHTLDNAGVGNCIMETGVHCGGAGSDSFDPRTVRGPIKVVMDKTPPVTTLVSVAGDVSSPYWDRTNNAGTDIIITGEVNMLCKWGTTDVAYYAMPFSCPVSGTNATCSLGSLAQSGSYARYVSCQDALGNQQNNAQNLNAMFGVDWTAPGAPALFDPVGTINTRTPVFDWSDVVNDGNGAADVSGVQSYTLLVSRDSVFSASSLVINQSNIASSTYTSPTLSEATYFWKVQAQDNAGNIGSFSPASAFTIDGSLPAASVVSPGPGSTQVAPGFYSTFWYSKPSGSSTLSSCQYKIESQGTVTLDWTSAGNCSGARNVYLTDRITVGPGLNCRIVGVDACTIRVRAIDTAGRIGAESSRSFTIRSGGYPSLPMFLNQQRSTGTSSIPNKGFTNESAVRLRASAGDPDNPEILTLFFEVRLSSESFSSVVTPDTGASCTTESFESCSGKIWKATSPSGDYRYTVFEAILPITGLPVNAYKWRVKACDDEPLCSDWKTFGSPPNFTVDNTPPNSSIDLQNAAGSAITRINQVGQPNSSLYIAVGGSSDAGGSGLSQVHFSSDSILNNLVDGSWTAWDQWNVSAGDWDSVTKKRFWQFSSPGSKEVFVQVKDGAENISQAVKDDITVNSNPASTLYRSNGVSYICDQDSNCDKLPNNWKKADFVRYVFDEDADGSVSSCSWMATNMGETSRLPCANDSFNQLTITVGPGKACATQGFNACAVYARNTDNESALADYAIATYHADWTPPVITNDFSPTSYQTGTVTFSTTVSDNVELNYCWLYKDSESAYPMSFYETVCGQGSSLSSCPGGTDCKACANVDIPDTNAHAMQVICSDQYDTEASRYLNTTSGQMRQVQGDTLSVSVSAIPGSGSRNTLFDLVGTVSGTMTGNINYKFDCDINQAPAWNLEINGGTANPYTATDLCQYASPGTYTAKVLAERGVGTAEDTVNLSVSANSAPEAAITCDPASCVVYDTEILTFRNASSDLDGAGDIIRSTWDILAFGSAPDLTCPPGPAVCNYTIQPMPTGDYTIQLSVEDSSGETDSAQQPFTLKRDIAVNFECSLNGSTWQACGTLQSSQGEVVRMRDVSAPSEEANAITSWAWTFQGGTPASASTRTVSTAFQSSGSKTVTLRVTDNAGRVRTGTQTINLAIPFPEWQEISPF